MSVIFNGAFSNIPTDRVVALEKGELVMCSDGKICSLVLRFENNVYEFKSKKIKTVVLASSASGAEVSVSATNSPFEVPSNHSHLIITCDCTGGSVVLNLPSIIDLPHTSLNVKRISNSVLKRLTVNASTIRLASGKKQLIDGSTSIKIGRKFLSAALRSTDTGWSIV